MSPKIAIIGGGIAGLAAAYRLSKVAPATRVTLFEASAKLGGVLQTVANDGFLVERSADSFLVTEQLPYAAELATDLSLESELISTNVNHRRALIVRGGKMFPVPQGFQLMAATRLLPLLTSPTLPFAARLRAAMERFVPAGSNESESVTEFISRRIGKQAFEYLAQPLVAGIYSADPDKLSAHAAIKQYTQFESTFGSVTRGLRESGAARSATSGARYGKFRSLRGGMGTLVEALGRSLNESGTTISLNTSVESIRRDGDRNAWQVAHGAVDSPSEFDAVIVACPAKTASKILQSADVQLAESLGAIPYTRVAVASLAVDKSALPAPLDAFGVVVPRRENRKLIAASFSSMKFAGRAPSDRELIRVFIGGALQAELTQLPAQELGQLACSELSSLLGLNAAPEVLDVTVWHQASPQYNVGHLDHVKSINRRIEVLPSLALAGSAYEGVGLPQCIRSGFEAADRAMHVTNLP